MAEQTSTALARTESAGLAMVVEPSEAQRRLHELQDFVRGCMVAGEDYGVIPGTSAGKDANGKQLPPKPVLLQPGAQKLAEIYGLAVTFEDSRPPIERWDEADPMFGYFKRAIVTRRTDGQFLGSGIGSCNSKEKKYASRWVFDNQIPPGLDVSKLQRKDGVSSKNGRPFTQYRVPNPEIFDLVNTIEKMACKRALVAAMISVTRSAGIFTQDLEDLAPMDGGSRPVGREEVPDADFEEQPPPPPRAPRAPEPDAWVVDPLLARLKRADGPAISAVWAEALASADITPKGCTVVRIAAITRWTEIAETLADCDGIAKLTKEQGFPAATERRLLDALNSKAKTMPDEGEEGDDADPRGPGGEE